MASSLRCNRPARLSRLAALAFAAMLLAQPVTALETDDTDEVVETVDETVRTVEETVTKTTTTVSETTESTSSTTTSATGGTLTGSSVSSPSTTDSTGAPSASASGSTVEVRLGGREIATVGKTKARTGRDGGASSDATVLSLLGHEIIGSHSTAHGGHASAQTGLLLHALCQGTGGSLCVSLLYGYAESSDDGNASSSEAYTNVAGVCAGGDQNAPHEECDGPIDVTVAESRSSAEANRSTGARSAQRSSTLADACVGGRNEAGTCDGIGATLLKAESSDGGDAQSQGVHLEGGGDSHQVLPHPGGFPPGDCGDDGSCIGFNDGATELGATAAPAPSAGGGDNDRWATASAEGGVLRASVGGNEIVRAGSTGAKTDRDHSASSDATVLALFGHEVIGAHSKAHDGSSEAETGYLTETCEASDGALCVALLYGRAASDDNRSSSSAESDTALASACAGGNRHDPTEQCEGGVNAEVGRSHSDASQDKSAGSAEANQVSDGAAVCLGGHNDQTGACDGLGVTVLHAESHSSASPDGSDGSSDSSIVAVDAGGEEQFAVDQEGDISVPPGCPEGQSLVCITLNSDTDADAGGGSGDGATAIEVALLPDDGGDNAADGQAGQAVTDADAGGGERTTVLNDATEPDADDPARRGQPSTSRTLARPAPAAPAAPGNIANPGALANTGLHLVAGLLLGLLLTALGTVAVRRARTQ